MTLSGTAAEATRTFAWDGFSFDLPVEWNLSSYAFERGTGRLAMEDDLGPRLEMDWLRVPRPVQADKLKRKRDGLDRSMRAHDAQAEHVTDLPPDWSADLFSLPDGRRLVLAYYRRRTEPFFCFLKLFWDDISRRVPLRVIRTLAGSFELHRGDLIPWSFYDVSFRLDRRCRLVQTAFHAGSKLLIFTWRRRRLFLWFVSLGSVALKQQAIETWAVSLLSAFKPLRYLRFEAGGPGRVLARRRKIHPLGHSEEIFRWCFRYKVYCRHDLAADRLLLGIFHHRHPRDVEDLRLAWSGEG